MSKRTVYTTITPLPAGITRETVMETLRSHTEMIDLNPLVEERHPIQPPNDATAEEYHCLWYSITDRISYLPGNMVTGKVTYNACFHDLEWGLQTHCYAPMGLNIRGKWTLGGSLPGEPIAPVELGVGAPLHGLYLREDVDMRCNIMMTNFVKKTTKKAHATLIERLLVKSSIVNASKINEKVAHKLNTSQASQFSGSAEYSPSEYPETPIEIPLFQRNDSTASHTTTYNDNKSLYPQPLKSRNSIVSQQGSLHGSQIGSLNGRNSFIPNNRVSWQSLNNSRMPSMHASLPSQQMDIPRSRSPSLQQQHSEHRRSPSVQHQHLSQLSSRSESPAQHPQQSPPPVYHQDQYQDAVTQQNGHGAGQGIYAEPPNTHDRKRLPSPPRYNAPGQFRAELE
ncbi:hypothetical protein B0O99DRAFT_596766 [Bisporella sp. PMI_857]|nr:hypothetical protein B0O99DRAFT_596766 [Bisporella sp. PMI_857]